MTIYYWNGDYPPRRKPPSGLRQRLDSIFIVPLALLLAIFVSRQPTGDRGHGAAHYGK